MFTIFKVLWENLRQGPSTDPFPFGETFTPDTLRGKAKIDPAACAGCGMCIHVCAGGAIRREEREDGSGVDMYLWHNTCTFCGMCEKYCPTGAIRLTTDWSTAHFNDEKYSYCEKEFIPFEKCEGCDTHIRVLPWAMLERIYSVPTEEIENLYRLCPECRRKKAALSLGE